MVTRVNGGPVQGVWFSKDVRFIDVTCTNGGVSFLSELLASPIDTNADDILDNVNGKLEQALEVIATRGTIIGLTVTGANTFSVIVDYAQAFDGQTFGPGAGVEDGTVGEQVQFAINAIADLSATGLTVEEGFVSNALGTPTP